jgi:hypothetical protein
MQTVTSDPQAGEELLLRSTLDTIPVNAPRELMEQYRSAFASADVDALLDRFNSPLQIVAITTDQASVSIARTEDWPHVLGELLSGYARLRVAEPVPLSLEVAEPIEGVAFVRVHWALQRSNGDPIYEFTAVYTLARTDSRYRIVAIAHDELPKLRAAMSAIQ